MEKIAQAMLEIVLLLLVMGVWLYVWVLPFPGL